MLGKTAFLSPNARFPKALFNEFILKFMETIPGHCQYEQISRTSDCNIANAPYFGLGSVE